MTLAVDVILFDADGVLQTTEEKWWYALSDLIGPADSDRVAAFFADLQTTERATLTGVTPFLPRLRELLERWSVSTPAEEVIELWHHIDVDPEMITAVRELTAAGTRCALATNQHWERATHMQQTLDYDEVFAPTFYSCAIGLAKPDPDYFKFALGALGVAPDRALFLDDNADNVAAALGVELRAELFDRYGSRPELDRILALHRA